MKAFLHVLCLVKLVSPFIQPSPPVEETKRQKEEWKKNKVEKNENKKQKPKERPDFCMD